MRVRPGASRKFSFHVVVRHHPGRGDRPRRAPAFRMSHWAVDGAMLDHDRGARSIGGRLRKPVAELVPAKPSFYGRLTR